MFCFILTLDAFAVFGYLTATVSEAHGLFIATFSSCDAENDVAELAGE